MLSRPQMIVHTLGIGLYLVSLLSHGNEVIDHALSAAIEKSLPGYGVYTRAFGALSESKEQYAAALLTRPVNENIEMQVAIFRRASNRSYQLVTHHLNGSATTLIAVAGGI